PMHAGLIDGEWLAGTGTLLRSVEAATGTAIDPGYPAATEADVDTACAAADAAFDAFRDLAPADRAAFLEAIAEQIMALGDGLQEGGAVGGVDVGFGRGGVAGVDRGAGCRLHRAQQRTGSGQPLAVDQSCVHGCSPCARPTRAALLVSRA
ncbi:MAG: aldehyde dehydrogenase family protein, partial [Sphingomonas sp.]